MLTRDYNYKRKTFLGKYSLSKTGFWLFQNLLIRNRGSFQWNKAIHINTFVECIEESHENIIHPIRNKQWTHIEVCSMCFINTHSHFQLTQNNNEMLNSDKISYGIKLLAISTNRVADKTMNSLNIWRGFFFYIGMLSGRGLNYVSFLFETVIICWKIQRTCGRVSACLPIPIMTISCFFFF